MTADAVEPDGARDVEATALRLLADREHSRKQLWHKLARRDHDERLIEQVLDGLVEQGLLSDRRFAEQYVDMRVRKGYGPLRIRAELHEHGIDGELAEILVDAHDWREQIDEVVGRKFGAGPAADRKEQVRRARFLQQRGFPSELIARVVLDD